MCRDRLIDTILWGDEENTTSVLDIKLDLIIDQTVKEYATRTAGKVIERMNQDFSKQLYYTARAARMWENEDPDANRVRCFRIC